MHTSTRVLQLLAYTTILSQGLPRVVVQAAPVDPCAVVGGQTWVAPSDLRACFQSFPVDETIKSNILEVVTKTLAFHTSVNYQVSAPQPFANDVHEDILGDLARIASTSYNSAFDLHIDISRSVKRLNDGHCAYIDMCFDSLFLSFVPLPLALLTDEQGVQAVHIAPEAFTVASAEFGNEISFWQNALPGSLNGQLQSLSGAKVLAINGADPFDAVNANAQITGGSQAFGTRQNVFFSSYNRASTGWNYIMGNFAQQALPLVDEVSLTVQRVGSNAAETFTIPYRSRIGTATVNFTDTASLRAGNCVAEPGTNGVNLNDVADASRVPLPGGRLRPQPSISPADAKKHFVSTLFEDSPPSNVVLPPGLTPSSPVSGNGVAQFFLLPDQITGVLALGSFSANSFNGLQNALLVGLRTLVNRGATRLIVDVTNNGGGFICIAHWLHRIIAGPKSTTVPQAGLDTEARAGPLAQLIVDQILENNLDPGVQLLYNPLNWAFANNTLFSADFNWLQNPVEKTINGRSDAFSLRLGQECQPFSQDPPDAPLFDTTKVAIVSNGRCSSSCSLFSITMAKQEGSKTVVVGGKQDVRQQYCGTVGGQSTDFSTIDTEVKTAGLKGNPLAPPDFLTNSIQGITWRLGFGIQDPTQPEEWQDHPADINFPLTLETVNDPTALWNAIAASVF